MRLSNRLRFTLKPAPHSSRKYRLSLSLSRTVCLDWAVRYWLPDLLKHEYVALRFLPQVSYEKAAKMRVSPMPDVVTRVFMLFRGVAKEDSGLWNQAAARATAEDGATFWTQIVGIDAERASDRGLFRVLEWGGMEVK
jgi:hypothetical protein